MAEISTEQQKKILSYGYEYTLVYVEERKFVPQPCAMGFENYALKSCKKVKPDDSEKELSFQAVREFLNAELIKCEDWEQLKNLFDNAKTYMPEQ